MKIKKDIKLDLIRVLAIVGVVTLHVAEGVNLDKLGTIYKVIIYLMLAISRCSVNLFGLLSGYLKIDRQQHHTSVLRIVFETVFWCLIMSIIGCIFFGLKSPSQILYNAFPILNDRLWYITCYCFVFLCAPYLNLLAAHLSKSGYKKLLMILTVLMCIIPTISMIDAFHIVYHGYSAGWLMFMYLLGGYFKLYGFSRTCKKPIAFLILLISVCVMVASLVGLQKFVSPFMTGLGINFDGTILYNWYNSPLVLLNSIIVFYLCVNANEIKNFAVRKVISWISVVSLGVYIIHAHPIVLDYVLIDKNLGWVAQWNPAVMIPIVFGLVLCVVAITGLLEQLRMVLFKICRIDKATRILGSKIDERLSIHKKVSGD